MIYQEGAEKIQRLNRNELSHSVTGVCKRPQLETNTRGDTQSKHSLSVSTVTLAHFSVYSSEPGRPLRLRHTLVSFTAHGVSSRSRPQRCDHSHLSMISPEVFPMKPSTLIPPPAHFTAVETFSIRQFDQ